jgi:hypothetical protein
MGFLQGGKQQELETAIYNKTLTEKEAREILRVA